MVELQEEWNFVRVLARHGPKHAERRSDGVAPPFNRELHEVFRIEVDRIGSERCAGGVLDSLIDGQYRNVAGSRQASRFEQLLQTHDSASRTVRCNEDSIDEIRPRQMQLVLRNRFALMAQQTIGIGPEYFLNSPHHELLLIFD